MSEDTQIAGLFEKYLALQGIDPPPFCMKFDCDIFNKATLGDALITRIYEKKGIVADSVTDIKTCIESLEEKKTELESINKELTKDNATYDGMIKEKVDLLERLKEIMEGI